MAYLITRNAADAEDAAQEAFVKAWRAIGRFRADAPLQPWLLRIVANEARNRRRTGGRRSRLQLSRGGRDGLGGRGPVPRGDRRRRRRACAGCSPRSSSSPTTLGWCSRAAILLELSEDETAAVLGVRRGTVKSRTARALDRLRETYERA